MTTLDDAAERRIDAISDQCTDGVIGTREAVEMAWTEATEAAAKKCDDFEPSWICNEDRPVVHAVNTALEECAASIRGKGG